MELEAIKSDYSEAGNKKFTKENLLRMIGVNNHPVLKGIRIQLIWESVAYTIFLAVYYNFFDGHLRSVLWNAILVFAVVSLLVHNMLGYQITNNPVNGHNIKLSLRNYLKRIRKYSFISIALRVFGIAMILGYFTSTIPSIENRHYWSIGGFILILIVQIHALRKVWSDRIHKISMAYNRLLGN